MKKTLTVNIGGVVFHIDDDAYAILNDYLEQIKDFLKNSSNRDEILTDIEHRIAEILKERLQGAGLPVGKEDVKHVIEVLGQPGEFAEEETDEAASYRTQKIRKRLYRDPDDKMIGGVCSGLANYFQMDPSLVRIIFVIAIFLSGASFLAYVILWAVVPAAVTPDEKREMQGNPVNLADLEQSVKKEMREVAKKLEELANQFKSSFTK